MLLRLITRSMLVLKTIFLLEIDTKIVLASQLADIKTMFGGAGSVYSAKSMTFAIEPGT